MKKRIFILLNFICILLILSGCTQNKNLEKEKGLSEIRFLENKTNSICTKYITDEYLNNEQIDWETIDEDVQMLNNSIDVILIDLASLKVPSKMIVELEEKIKNNMYFVKEKDVNNLILNVCDIYNLVSNSIFDYIEKDESLQLQNQLKSELFYIGYYRKINNNEEVIIHLSNLENKYSELILNKDFLENNSYKVNMIFLNIQKLKDSIVNDNFELSKSEILKILELI